VGVGGQHHVPTAYPPEKRQGSHCTGGYVGPRAGLDGCGNLAPTGIRSPDRLARSDSLYRIRKPSVIGLPSVVFNTSSWRVKTRNCSAQPGFELSPAQLLVSKPCDPCSTSYKPASVVVHVTGIKVANSSVTLNSQDNCTHENRPFEAFIHRDRKPPKISGLESKLSSLPFASSSTLLITR